MAAYSPVNQNLLKVLIKDELELEFGTSESPTTLDKYAKAISIAIAKHFYDINFYPDEDDDI